MSRRGAAFAAILWSLAGCSGPGAPSVGEDVVEGRQVAARVNGEPVYIDDIEVEAVARGLVLSGSALREDGDAYRQVLEQLVDQKLMAQEARRLGLDREPAGQRRLEMAQERILGNLLVENLVASVVTDEMIDRMYGEQVRLQQVNDVVSVAHILVATRDEAAEILRLIEAGEAFETLVSVHSLDGASRMEQGDLGYVSPNQMPDPFPVVIADTPVGEVSPPFETEQGWHLLKVKDRRTQPPQTRDEMRPEIATFLTLNEVSRILRRLRTEAVIEHAEGYNGDPADGPVPPHPVGDEL